MATDPTVDPTAIDIALDPMRQHLIGITAHKHLPFDVPVISEISRNLWQGGCREGLVLPDFVKHLVSLYPWEQYDIRHTVDSEMYVRMYDSAEQGFEQVDALAAWVNVCRETGPVLIHCQVGLNRSSLVAARAMVLSEEADPAGAIAVLRERRSPACLCNEAFEAWLLGEPVEPASDSRNPE
ncbi:protein tyrosine phosphatase [Rhodococcus hoagii]|uniref:Protein tyrosine phosphatase n=2 Tax=Rhodococcus hoagii TaxID=43767 RepID=A0A9Q4ZJ40_RHOHA|nr:dual specificity protein phosphatase family protein [Prescottella equi]MCD7049702.1 dual specificity protein phosphatase family protein [Rhodococcus sp. BH2-1]ERN44953.1 dual specificity protein phosphatase [Prescottella equi NBRC 101255 = C 7]MBM4485213.1 protein tyrosine phosphatase [Prescottella equi]MBM4489028.1 protein tyrosine phosphatase [Prescottella equi]MBM4498462.1 protein tyrosine phosphatase [Prescottella equi]